MYKKLNKHLKKTSIDIKCLHTNQSHSLHKCIKFNMILAEYDFFSRNPLMSEEVEIQY